MTPVATPEALNATPAANSGEIELKWKPVRGANSYTIERSTDPTTTQSRSNGDAATKSRARDYGLTRDNVTGSVLQQSARLVQAELDYEFLRESFNATISLKMESMDS